MVTENIEQNGRHFATLTEQRRGNVITQRSVFADDQRAYAGAPLGGCSVSVRLADDAVHQDHINELLAAFAKVCNEPGMKSAGRSGLDGARAHLTEHGPYCVLEANNYPARA